MYQAKSSLGSTALLFATGNGHIEVVKKFLDGGAEIKAKDPDNWTAPLCSAGWT